MSERLPLPQEFLMNELIQVRRRYVRAAELLDWLLRKFYQGEDSKWYFESSATDLFDGTTAEEAAYRAMELERTAEARMYSLKMASK